MAITTDADFVYKLFPAMESVPSERIECYIEVAKGSVSESVWGEKADYAVALLAAHLVTVLTLRSADQVSALKRKRVGQVEVEYMAGSQGDPLMDLSLTAYGQEYLRCRRMLVMLPRVASCP